MRALLLAPVALLSLTSCVLLTTSNDPSLAFDSAARSDLSIAKLAIVAYMSDHQELPKQASELDTYGYSPSDGVSTITIMGGDDAAFCLEATSESGTVFQATDVDAPTEGECEYMDLL